MEKPKFKPLLQWLFIYSRTVARKIESPIAQVSALTTGLMVITKALPHYQNVLFQLINFSLFDLLGEKNVFSVWLNDFFYFSKLPVNWKTLIHQFYSPVPSHPLTWKSNPSNENWNPQNIPDNWLHPLTSQENPSNFSNHQ